MVQICSVPAYSRHDRAGNRYRMGFAMLSDLTARSLYSDAYSDRPYSFLDQDAQNYLANITAIDLIENGDRAARENWQNRQLSNLLKHAHSRSKFWRQRM